MYRPRAYTIDDIPELHSAIRARRFAIIAAAVSGIVQFAYAPVVLDTEPAPLGKLRFHLARANAVAELARVRVVLSFLGPDAYISPDWYATRALVPTWNYVVVEASGIARTLEVSELRRLLADLSAAEEAQLAPKPPWTLDKVPEERISALLGAIRGFEVMLDALEGKFKLSQDKNAGDRAGDRAGVICGLEARGDAASLAVAASMRGASREP